MSNYIPAGFSKDKYDDYLQCMHNARVGDVLTLYTRDNRLTYAITGKTFDALVVGKSYDNNRMQRTAHPGLLLGSNAPDFCFWPASGLASFYEDHLPKPKFLPGLFAKDCKIRHFWYLRSFDDGRVAKITKSHCVPKTT